MPKNLSFQQLTTILRVRVLSPKSRHVAHPRAPPLLRLPCYQVDGIFQENMAGSPGTYVSLPEGNAV